MRPGSPICTSTKPVRRGEDAHYDLPFAPTACLDGLHTFDLIDPPAGRRRSSGKGRSPGHLSPLAEDRKGAPRWLAFRSGYLPGECPSRTAARWRSHLHFPTRAARASSSGHSQSGCHRRHARSALQERFPRHNRRLPRRNGRGSWSRYPEARRKPAASRNGWDRLGDRPHTSSWPFLLTPRGAGHANPESRDLLPSETVRGRPSARPSPEWERRGWLYLAWTSSLSFRSCPRVPERYEQMRTRRIGVTTQLPPYDIVGSSTHERAQSGCEFRRTGACTRGPWPRRAMTRPVWRRCCSRAGLPSSR